MRKPVVCPSMCPAERGQWRAEETRPTHLRRPCAILLTTPAPGQVLASLPRMPSSTQQTPTHLSCPSPCPRPLTSRLEAPTPCPALSLLERLLRPRLTRARPVAQTCAPSAFARAGHRPCRREAGSGSSGPGARSAQSSPALWLSRTRSPGLGGKSLPLPPGDGKPRGAHRRGLTFLPGGCSLELTSSVGTEQVTTSLRCKRQVNLSTGG